MKADLIIFDLDGTLIDSSGDIAWSANRTLESYGYPVKGVDEIRENVGWGIKNLLEKLMPGESKDRLDEARLKFLDFYAGHLIDDSKLYPGVLETLVFFRGAGKKLAVATNKPFSLAEGILKALEMRGLFEMVVGGDSLPTRKPSPEPVLEIINRLKADAVKTVLVGDSPIDSETGRGAGIKTVGVTFGFRPKEELIAAGFDSLIDHMAELRGIIG